MILFYIAYDKEIMRPRSTESSLIKKIVSVSEI